MSRPRVPILELDADLAEGVHPDQRALATRYATAPVVQLSPGPWMPDDNGEGSIGLLVLEGMMTRSVGLGVRVTTELLGEGDLLRPWDHDAGGAQFTMHWQWSVLETARVATLDRRFAAVVARWPALVDALVSRALRRSRMLAFQLALAQVKRVEDRLLLLMWQLAERWGHVSPEGVYMTVPLTHETLAMLVAARRPTVTTALGALMRDGRLERQEDGWLLHGSPPPMSEL